PARERDVDAWLRGIALEHIAASVRLSGPPQPHAAAAPAMSGRLHQALRGISDRDLGAMVRALEPRARQAIVLGIMSGLDDATVAAVTGLRATDVPGLQAAGLADIARLLQEYDRETEQMGELARKNAYHLRPRPGPMSDGLLVLRGSKLMVEPGPAGGVLTMAIRAFERLLDLLLHRHRLD